MNKMKIKILPKSKAKEFSPDETWAAISVSTYKEEFAKLSGCKRMGLLQLEFLDAVFASTSNSKLFTAEQAEDILKFVDSVRSKIEILFVHCEAGISRSPAIGAALDYIYNGNHYKPYFQKYSPNELVFRTILEVAAKQGRIEFDGNIPVAELEELELEIPLEIIE